METTRVFRLEDRTGTGAFQAASWDVIDELDRLIPDYVYDRPMPQHDGGRLEEVVRTNEVMPWDVRFGCPSLELLRHWFPPSFATLLEPFEVELTVWEVPAADTYAGEHQIAFRPDLARCVERLPLAELHKLN